MSKSSIESRALAMVASDLRLFTLAAEAVVVWVRLISAILEYGADGILHAGKDGAPDLATLARFRFHVSETQLETYMETYARTRLITYDAASGLVGLPETLQPTRRAIASRLNGKKGGRPPKNANPAPQHDPRQRTAMMPISGGKTVSQETQCKTQPSHARAKLSLADNISLEDKAKLGAQVDDAQIDTAYQRIGPMAFEAAGFDPARDMGNYRIVRQWAADAMRSGLSADETERLILGVVGSVAERQRSKGAAISHLGYFGKAIGTAIANRDVPEAPLSECEIEADRAWKRDIDTWRERVASGVAGAGNDPIPNRADYLDRARKAA
ncbi:hypothetical protein HW511_00310 [Asaia siamensis]|uniref:Uncharacterized protein n=1 Tax=Asaia siamensis TaxID=110479 RepID=A0ABQ1M859_9PROT|nr:hypothetical protein [Asaia siamensis]GBR06371.1 hypothetical protein AA0323_1371 [Asaia siamensis NRIC 0323]GGC34277.1 hypothetical protein GCM10007207_19800 [Asaia siamensis]